MRFDFIDTPLAGLKIVQRKLIEDSRGFLSRLYCADDFAAAKVNLSIAQINQTHTRRKGAARGLHFQHPPHTETKLVTCLSGSVFDVAVDLRQGSPTFLHWHAAVLSADNHQSLLIPAGFAHGFQTLEDNSELFYLHSAPYVAAAEGALNVNDAALAIDWPLPIAELSERDSAHAPVDPNWQGLAL
jgi:dTDP-4-dehydrorhamnose 3,5-epimerase